MKIIDVQFHEPSVWLDWHGADEETEGRLYLELVLAAMKAVGVDAVAFNPMDTRWARKAALEYPDTFAVYPIFDPLKYDASEKSVSEHIAQMRRDPAIVAVRLSLGLGSPRWETLPGQPNPATATHPIPARQDLTAGIAAWRNGEFDEFFGACEREGLPVFILIMSKPSIVGEIAKRFPNLTLIVDHLGASQPPVFDRDEPPTKHLVELAALAKYPNVTVKFSSGPALSNEAYPYNDVWEGGLTDVVEAFGADRLLWAADMSRIYGRLGNHRHVPYGEGDYPGKHNYREALDFVLLTDRLDQSQKEWILGKSAEKWLGWPKA